MTDHEDEGPPRRGEGPGVELDLHGHTVDAALRRLAQELARWRAGGVTRGRVITGLGFGSHGGRARLAPEVEGWLQGEGRAYGVVEVRAVPGLGAFDVRVARN